MFFEMLFLSMFVLQLLLEMHAFQCWRVLLICSFLFQGNACTFTVKSFVYRHEMLHLRATQKYDPDHIMLPPLICCLLQYQFIVF